jgi:hypothetical protein
MKLSIFILFNLALLISCKPSGSKVTTEVTSEPEIITSTDSGAVAPQIDSLNIDPRTNETAMQQDPPSTNTTVTPPSEEFKPTPVKICDPSFKSLAVPKRNQHIIYVSGFKVSEFKCWNILEEYGASLCGTTPCQIYFVDAPDVKATTTAPHFINAQDLIDHGVGHFEFDGDFWTVKGASIWKRKGKEYGYYNTNNHLGG